MNVSVVGEHLLISLVPWLAGIVVGGGLGYACALVARSLFSTRPGLRRVSMLLPWRTVVVTFAALAAFSPLVYLLVGVGTSGAATMVALFVLVLALPFTVVTLLEHWYPSPLAVRLIAGSRILATASVAVAAFAPMVRTSGGVGPLIFPLIFEGMRLLDYPRVLTALSIVVLLAFIIDILLGALQLLFAGTSTGAQPAQSANN